jgi:hypothetical protein
MYIVIDPQKNDAKLYKNLKALAIGEKINHHTLLYHFSKMKKTYHETANLEIWKVAAVGIPKTRCQPS